MSGDKCAKDCLEQPIGAATDAWSKSAADSRRQSCFRVGDASDMEKEQFRGTSSTLRVSHLCFSVADPLSIRKQAHIQCYNNILYDTASSARGRKSIPHGVLDNRLGTSQNNVKCDSCGLGLPECVGHFGYIDLQLPVFHVGYFRFILSILSCICKRCSRFLLPESADAFRAKIRRPDLSYLEKKSIHKDIVAKCKKVKQCSYCKFMNGNVRKIGLYKILHVPPTSARKRKTDDLKNEASNEETLHQLVEALEGKDSQELIDLLHKTNADLLDPLKVMSLFRQIPSEEYCLLLINDFKPEDLLVTRVPVPPSCIRPSVVNDIDASNEDDLTVKLSEIIFVNDVIAKRKSSGAQMSMIVEDWDYLQLHMALYINSETSGIPFSMRPKKPSRGLVQRLKGKHGRFRGNLSGKRVDFSSRSVISPNPNLHIDEVGVPEYIAKILTFPEKVNDKNREKLKLLVMNGADKYPGANFVEQKNGKRIFLRYSNRVDVARNLTNGTIVERHLMEGDKVLFNRQPSLHKLSIMCHKAKVHCHRTLQFNECACTPYNADFDGDEMNLHLPQTLEATAEADVLMGIKNNIVTPRNGEPLIAAIQDFITGGYLLTHKDTYFDRSKACQIISYILASKEVSTIIDLPHPCIVKPKQLWSGKQLFSRVIAPSLKKKMGICLTCKTKNYSGNGEELCLNDGYIVVRDDELLCGTVDKSILGSGSKNNIFYIMLRDVNSDAAADAMWRLARVASYFLANRGFSLGIDDVTPTPGLIEQKKMLLESGYSKVDQFIQSQKDGRIDRQPGQTVEQTLENMIQRELSSIRDAAGKTCVKELDTKNIPLTMAVCGSKGSLINVSQMVACVGQQVIRGARVPDGFGDRSLPHFDHKEKTPLAKGFVENSFYSGLTATEFFFHTMAGREGLLDTAVKTAETGYMQRRLVKALEDLVSHYDGSVRNSYGDVIQFIYGDDYLDPVNMEDNQSPVHFPRLLNHVRCKHPCEKEVILEPGEMVEMMNSTFDDWTKKNINVTEGFKSEIEKFIAQLAQKAIQLRKNIPNFYQNKAAMSIDRLTKSQMETFLAKCLDKFQKAILEPGTAVGAICAQSIGEPATQMTLKTFHFAGVASMNITQGVPRIKELINANKTISTPIIRASLMNPRDPNVARQVKMRIERTTLGEICEYMDQMVLPDDCFVLVKLYPKRIKLLRLEVNDDSIQEAISTQLKISVSRIQMLDQGILVVRPSIPSELWQLREALMNVVVKGIKGIKRAAIRVDEKNGNHYLMIEGEGLLDVMATYGVDPAHSYSNNVLEIASTLGIEAARATIISEIRTTMEGHGISVDQRHLKLLADTMTYRGEVLGITRFGLAKMKESALMLASFEKTADHLFDAAYFSQKDPVIGVSESIISGVAMKLGTGFFDLLYRPEPSELARRGPLFDDPSLHRPFKFSSIQ